MNIYHLVILLVRFLAICLAIHAINSLVFAWISYQTSGVFSFAALGMQASIMLAGILIWFLPVSVARSITGYADEAHLGSDSITLDQFAAVTFLILALYLGYRVVSDGSYWLYYHLYYKEYGLVEVGIDAESAMFATLMEALFLVVMLLGRRGIFNLFRKLRSFSSS